MGAGFGEGAGEGVGGDVEHEDVGAFAGEEDGGFEADAAGELYLAGVMVETEDSCVAA